MKRPKDVDDAIWNVDHHTEMRITWGVLKNYILQLESIVNEMENTRQRMCDDGK